MEAAGDLAVTPAAHVQVVAVQLEVVAEGVETDEQYAIVRRLGCDLVQGYFIAKPMPADQLLVWAEGYEDTQSCKSKSAVISIDGKRW